MARSAFPPPNIIEQPGVCGVREDTVCLADMAAEQPPGRALDMGTGTGYIAIRLAQQGWQVVATDVSPRALRLARRNAQANAVDIEIIESDLFSAVDGLFDVILFNPPMRADETELSRLLTSILRKSPAVSALLMRLTHGWLGNRRLPFLLDFCRQARNHLAAGGRLLLAVGPEEADALVAELPEARLVEFRAVQSIPHLGIADVRFEIAAGSPRSA
ncbi:MAG: methyltransferase domain-containing protein [Caldilineae bacterium]|nr:MAG: methyltransferase domain-containing protein [Caldilineae bacterium]